PRSTGTVASCTEPSAAPAHIRQPPIPAATTAATAMRRRSYFNTIRRTCRYAPHADARVGNGATMRAAIYTGHERAHYDSDTRGRHRDPGRPHRRRDQHDARRRVQSEIRQQADAVAGDPSGLRRPPARPAHAVRERLMVQLTRIYTRGGDKGQTSLGTGRRVPKHDLRVEAYGTVDEANCVLGLARLHTEGDADAMLALVQNDLFDLGADLCTPEGEERKATALRIVDEQVDRLEREIDAMNGE